MTTASLFPLKSIQKRARNCLPVLALSQPSVVQGTWIKDETRFEDELLRIVVDVEDMLRRVPNLSKIKALIGYQPTLGVDQIVDKVIEFERPRHAAP